MVDVAPIVEMQGDPPPAGLRMFWTRGFDGVTLRVATAPAAGSEKGAAVLSPGRSEYIEKYFEVMRDLTRAGIAVAVVDHRGQGMSERLLPDRLKGHVGHFSDYARDLETIWPQLTAHMNHVPWLVAHSMGGAIAADVARRKQVEFAGLAGSSPMLGFYAAGGFMEFAIRTMALLGARQMTPPGLSGGGALDPAAHKILTSDLQRFNRDLARCTKETRLQLAGPTVGWLDAAVQLHHSLMAPGGYDAIEVPVWFAIAEREQLVSNDAIAIASRQISNCETEIFEDALHEIPQERDALRGRLLTRWIERVTG